ncbi:MAG: peptidoglycan-binding protein [Clostridia bacterium]|nr:peptidoglycan-binding protein [Clostridia bacterium]
MRNWKIAVLSALTAGAVFALPGCGVVDESFLDTEANYTVDISVPYATATPLPEYLNVPDPIVIDQDGNVTLNDASIIEGSFQSARDAEQQTEYRSLTLGSNGIAVQALQSRLKELGYFSGEITGLFDVDTEAAVRRFEQTYGTMQTGVATQKLQLRLFASTAPVYGSAAYNEAVVSQYAVLRPGTVGSSVYALQQRLKNLDYPITDLTGAYDDQTALCVRLFYQMYGIMPSDVADVNMQRQLYSEDALHYDASVQPLPTNTPEPSEVDEDSIQTMEDVIGRRDDDGGIQRPIGNTDPEVVRIQQRLIALGYMAEGGDTGVFDNATVAAVNRFLSAIGREPGGTLNEEMQAFLFSDSAPSFGGEIADTEYQNLSPGDSGEAVMNLQRRLVQLGYANGNPNGQYGNATISAVQLYQQSNGMDVDGLASAWLQATLFSNTALTYAQTQGLQPIASAEPTPEPTPQGDALYFNLALGATGNAVRDLQNRLIKLGYSLTATKTYDEATRQAVLAFQSAIGVTPTGEASASLQRYIYSKAAPGPTVRFYNVPQAFQPLSLGSTGDAVSRLQQQLFSLNLIKREDIQSSIGTYNEATRQAVISAQKAMGYQSPDGVAGVEFQSFLFSKYSKKIKQK